MLFSSLHTTKLEAVDHYNSKLFKRNLYNFLIFENKILPKNKYYICLIILVILQTKTVLLSDIHTFRVNLLNFLMTVFVFFKYYDLVNNK